MPSRFKGRSEYQKNYKWNESRKSAAYQPPDEVDVIQAGVPSTKQYISIEPAIQGRKHPNPPPNAVELIGGVDNGSEISSVNHPVGRKGPTILPPEPPKRVQPQPQVKKQSRSLSNSPPRLQLNKENDRHGWRREISPPPTPRDVKKNAVARDDRTTMNGHGPPQRPAANAEISTQNEDRALQHRAGIKPTVSHQGPSRQSEYQKQFKWKDAMKEAPSAKTEKNDKADKAVYKSAPEFRPLAADKIARVSEYKKEFKPWRNEKQPVFNQRREERDDSSQPPFNGPSQAIRPTDPSPARKSRKSRQRSKTVEITKSHLQSAGVRTAPVPDDPRLTEPSLNPVPPFFPHANARKWRTEYKSNYKSPDNCQYEGGAWKGANVPHVQPHPETPDKPVRGSGDEGSNWFSEVQELRNRAQDYAKRQQGTHFSREHLAQLIAEQARVWEQASTDGTVSALSLALQPEDRGHARAPLRKSDVRPAERRGGYGRDNIPDQYQDDTHGGADHRDGEEVPAGRQQAREAWGDPPSNQHGTTHPQQPPQPAENGFALPSPTDTAKTTESTIRSSGVGRLTTPNLENLNISKRHHLDRTTPVRGGAMLSSPPRLAKSTPALNQAGRSGNGPLRPKGNLERALNQPPPPPQPGQDRLKFGQTAPTFGSPTADLHKIRTGMSDPEFTPHGPPQTMPSRPKPNIDHIKQWEDMRQDSGSEDEAADQPPKRVPAFARTSAAQERKQAQTRPSAAELRLDNVSDDNVRNVVDDDLPVGAEAVSSTDYHPLPQELRLQPAKPRRALPPARDNVNVMTLPADYYHHDSQIPKRPVDDDQLSIMSIASLTSMSSHASQTLDRARKRKDDFWGRQTAPARV